jgi:hypothetical protein
METGPAGAVLVCDQEILVCQHAATPLRHNLLW